MTSRPPEHVTGDSGELAVASIFTAAGSAVDFIHRDYGDDLLVQTTLDGKVDASRLWVQVKSRKTTERLLARTGERRLRVSTEHALKWLRSADLAVVILWDTSRDAGWWCAPTEQLHEFVLRLNKPKTVALRFAEDRAFDTDAARLLSWHGRRHGIARALHAIDPDESVDFHFDDVGTMTVRPTYSVALIRALEDLRIITSDGIAVEFRRLVVAAYKLVRLDHPGAPWADHIHLTVMMALLAQAQEVTGEGLTRELLMELIPATIRALEVQDDFGFPDEPPSIRGVNLPGRIERLALGQDE